MIDWSLSLKQFHYNGRDLAISSTHTKDTAWKIKLSTFTVAILDILNRNYSAIIDNQLTCLLCELEPETNLHVWSCTKLSEAIKYYFCILANKLEQIFTQYGDKFTTTCKDTIKYSPTFHQAVYSNTSDPYIPQEAFLFFYAYITTSLVNIFKLHFTSSKTAQKHLFAFMQEALLLFTHITCLKEMFYFLENLKKPSQLNQTRFYQILF